MQDISLELELVLKSQQTCPLKQLRISTMEAKMVGVCKSNWENNISVLEQFEKDKVLWLDHTSVHTIID